MAGDRLTRSDRLFAFLLRLFPRDIAHHAARGTPATPPEWIMTGAWVTVPPEQTDRLTEETRPFANEFQPAASDNPAANNHASDLPAPRAVEMPSRERVRGRRTDRARPLSREETPLPPHGDKLR